MRRVYIIAGAVIALVVTAATADARTRERSGTITHGKQGKTVTYQSTTTRSGGVSTTQTTYTNQNGTTGTKTTTRTKQSDGTTAVQTTGTGPQGTAYTRDRTVGQ